MASFLINFKNNVFNLIRRNKSNFILVLFLILPGLAANSREPGVKAKATVQPNGWFTYWDNLEEFTVKKPWTEAEVDQAIQAFSKVNSVAKKKGIIFLWVIPPNTTTVYPQSMPKRFQKFLSRPTRLQLLSKAFSESSELGFLDLSSELIKNKDLGTLYQKTDTHWNILGAYIGYKSIFERLQVLKGKNDLDLLPLKLTDFKISFKNEGGGDLAGILGIRDFVTEVIPDLTPIKPLSNSTAQSGIEDSGWFQNNNQKCPGNKLLMFQDSYAGQFQFLFSNHFCKIKFVPSWNYKSKWIDEVKPNIIIVELVERNLDTGTEFLETLGRDLEVSKSTNRTKE